MSNATTEALANVDLLSLLSERDLGHDAIGLRDLEREGLAGRRDGRWYARRCVRGIGAIRCDIDGCELHTMVRA